MIQTPARFRAALFAAATLAAAPSHADWAPAWGFVQAGAGASDSDVALLGAGAAWPFDWRAAALGGELTAFAEAYGNAWRVRAFGGGHQTIVQLGLVPMLRYRLDGGRSPWFVEGGIGASVTHKRYVTPDKTFSTNWNFSDNLALGYSFGAERAREVSLRWQHISNAGIRKPNPGEDLVMVRYAAKF